MAQVKRAGYPSKQQRAGPAPLASFEDLPSDELESPDSLAELEECTISSQASRPVDLDGSSTPRTLTASALSTPQLDSDGDSQFTLTPCDTAKSQIPGSLKTSSLSSLKNGKEEDHQGNLSSSGRKKGSISSLLSSGEGSHPSREGSHRKGSWTDIFRSRSRSRSRSPQGSPHRLRKGSDTSAKYRSDTESNERNGTISKKEKSKFLSLFKIGNKKSPKSKSPSPPNFLQEPQDASVVEVKKTKSSVNKAEPQKDEFQKTSQTKAAPSEKTETPVEKACSTKIEAPVVLREEKRNRPTEIDLESVHGLPTTHIRQKHEETDTIPHKAAEPPLREPKNEKISPPHVSDVEGNHESSESELTFEVNGSSKPPLEKDSEEDCEAENLLNQDSTDAEEFSAAEYQLPPPSVDSSHSQIKTPTRKQRLEVTTIPIERPRSTTPINIAPLEAFIQSATPSPDPGVEKIRLSLPGDQFGSRPRSPKKSSIKSWQDFCEEGLHSPRLNKRPQNDDDEFDLALKSPVFDIDTTDSEEQNKLILSENSPIEEEEASWVTFENIHDDNLVQKANTLDITFEKDQKWKNNYSDNDAFQSDNIDTNKDLFSECSCVCHSYGCDCHFVAVDIVNRKFSHNPDPIFGAKELPGEAVKPDSHAETVAEKPKLSSLMCECDCHKQVIQSKHSTCSDSGSPVDQPNTVQEEQK